MVEPPDVVVLPRVPGPVNADARLPGSKSLANRALLAAALADGRSTIHNVPECDDVDRMIAALQELGVAIQHDPASGRTTLDGVRGQWPSDEAAFDAGGAGTVLRFLTAAVCVGQGDFSIDGAPQLRARPIGGLIDALRQLGVAIQYDDRAGHCPITVTASGLAGGLVHLDASESSQFLSALLLAAPYARRDVLIDTAGPLRSRPFVAMTEHVMRAFGAATIFDGQSRWIVPGMQRYTAADYAVEPDATAASYFLGLAALTGGRIRIRGLSGRAPQGDMRALDLLESMGCAAAPTSDGVTLSAPAGAAIRAIDADFGDTPDLVPTFAVLAMFADAPSRFRGVPHLRLKESDRLYTVAEGVQRLGGKITIHDDGLTIAPAARPTPAIINTYDDHRIAMAFAMATARVDEVTIQPASCVSKSFPGFWAEWRRVTGTA